MVVVNLRIQSVRLVMFFVKAAPAAIPAAIIVGFLVKVITALIAALVGDGGLLMIRRWSFQPAADQRSANLRTNARGDAPLA